MINYQSKVSDIVRVAYHLKNILGNRVYINTSALYLDVLKGKYHLSNDYLITRDKGLNFSIRYSRGEFMRLSISGDDFIYSFATKEAALLCIASVLSNMLDIEGKIGSPFAFYTVLNGDKESLSLEWSLCKCSEYMNSFREGNILEDGRINKLIRLQNFFEPKESEEKSYT